jgi:nucleoside-diphosphate-sugar epimerase
MMNGMTPRVKEFLMNIFLTGATGYVGSGIALTLQQAGHTVIGLVRSEIGATRLQARGIQTLLGDLSDRERIAQGAREADAVIHAASPNNADTPRLDTQVVDTILDTLAGSHKPFIYTSGSWVLGSLPADVVGNEETLPVPPLIVAWRPALEQRILSAIERGVHAIVLRPGLVYGYGGGIPGMLVHFAQQEGVSRTIGNGENVWSLIHRDDLADAYLRALTIAPAGTLLNIVSEPAVPFQVIAEAVATACGLDRPLEIWQPEMARRTLGPLVDALLLHQPMSGARARSILHWTPQAPSILEELEYGSYRVTSRLAQERSVPRIERE